MLVTPSQGVEGRYRTCVFLIFVPVCCCSTISLFHSDLSPVWVADASAVNTPVEDGESGQKDDDDDEGLNIKSINADPQRPIVAPRWPTRVFAIECMLKIIAACDGNDAHFQLDTAKALRHKGSGQHPPQLFLLYIWNGDRQFTHWNVVELHITVGNETANVIKLQIVVFQLINLNYYLCLLFDCF